jgi:tRNA threonylcarbamoyl adenosine modification protein YeaZ
MTEFVLGIDTSAGAGAGVVRIDGPEAVVLAHQEIADTRSHAEKLVILIRDALKQAGIGFGELTQIAVGMGPAPFTGLRVGVVSAEVLGWGRNIPVKHVSSLDALALRAVREPAVELDGEFVAALDARRKQFYWARYSAAGAPLGDPQVNDPEDLPELPLVGPMGQLDPRPVSAAFLAANYRDLAEIGSEPLYLRPADAELPRTRKSALTGATLRIEPALAVESGKGSERR